MRPAKDFRSFSFSTRLKVVGPRASHARSFLLYYLLGCLSAHYRILYYIPLPFIFNLYYNTATTAVVLVLRIVRRRGVPEKQK